VTGQFFFTTIAALALSTAGFASLVTALRHEGRWSRVSLWRLRAIVGESLTITIVAILPLPLYYALDGDEAAVIRITSGVLAI
jgi:anti-sigma-K factor RskA